MNEISLESAEHRLVLAQIKEVLASYGLGVAGFVLGKAENPDLEEHARRILTITEGVK